MCEILVVVRYVWPEILIVPVRATVTLDCTVCTVIIGRATIPATREVKRISQQLHFTNMNTITIFEPPNRNNRYELIQSLSKV